MNSFKKWILLFVIVLIISILGVFLFNYIVDPFGVFGDKVFKWDSYNIVNNPRIGKITYLDKNYKNYNSYIIGGSKSSSISPKLLNEYYGGDTSFYSMMMYGGEFHDYGKTVQYLIDNYDVENIIIHMSTRELAIYNEDPKINNTMKAEVEDTSKFKYYFRFLTLDLKHSVQKLEGYVRKNYDPFEYGYIIPETGVYDKSKRDIEINETEEEFFKRNPDFSVYEGKLQATFIQNNLNSLKEIKEYCDKNNVNFMFIIAPTYDKEVEQFTLDEFDRFIKGSTQITDLWNFSGYTSVGNDARNFYDPLHYTNKIGKMMLARIFNNIDIYVPDDFGYYVTKENVNEYLKTRSKTPIKSASKININLPILMYHHIQNEIVDSSYSIITLNKFKEDIKWLKEHNYNTIFFQDAIDYINGKKTLPDNPIIITFDDGYLSNYEYAYPILKENDMKATIFIIGWSVGRNTHKDDMVSIFPHFTWEQAREMYNSGFIDIQTHSYDMHDNNMNLGRIGITQKENETIDDYKNALENDSNMMKNLILENVGNEISFMAYPYGEYSENTVDILRDLGYQATVTTINDTNNIYLNMYNLYNLNRINMFQHTTMESIGPLLNKKTDE